MRKISWYNNEGKIKFTQNCAVGLESASCPEDGLNWIEGCPEVLENSSVVDNEIVNGTKSNDDTLEIVRKIRQSRLKNCDWTQAADSPLSNEKKAEWATYRQALRDLPEQYTNADVLSDVVFPSQPE